MVNLANCSLNCTLMYRAELALKNALAQGLPEIERAGAPFHRHGSARGDDQPTRAGGGDAQDAAAADAEAPGGEASADEDATAPAAAGVRERFLQWMAVQVGALGIRFRDGIRVGVRDVGRDTVRDRIRRWRRRAYLHCPLFTPHPQVEVEEEDPDAEADEIARDTEEQVSMKLSVVRRK